MFASITRAAIAAALFFIIVPAQAQETRLTRDEGRSFAVLFLRSDQPAAAKAIAEGLLSADPQDSVALTLLSQAERSLGNFQTARQAGQAAWTYATDDRERFAAATVTAQALTSEEKYTRAQFWLRRASNFAPNDTMVQTLARDFATLLRMNPLKINLAFGVAPTSNVNNGSSVDSIEFGGLTFLLSPSAQSLSGYEFSGSANLNYRVHEDERSRTTIGADALILRYAMTDESRTLAPSFDPSDRAFNRLELFARRDWAANFGLLSAELAFSTSTLGNDPYSKETLFGLERIWLLSDTVRLDGALSVGDISYTQSGDTAQVWSSRLSWRKVLTNDDSVQLDTAFGRTYSDNSSLANTIKSIGMTYDFGPIAESFKLDVGLGYQWRDFEPSALAPFGREDRKTSMNVNIGFPDIEYFGFTPVVQFEAQSTASNIARYQTETVSVDFSFRSSF